MTLEDSAIKIIKKHEPPEGYWVAFSGGKDSIVVYDLVKRSEVKYDAHFNQTTVDPPEIYSFIRENYPEVIWEKPKRSMFKLIASRTSPPTRQQRYCCTELKKMHGVGRVLITGIRSQESSTRKSRGEYEISRHNPHTFYCNPIIGWSEDDVWGYIKKYRMDYPVLYDRGYSRTGCIMCPFQNPYSMCMDAMRYPKFYAAYLNSFQKVLYNCYSRKSKTDVLSMTWKTPEDIMFWWIYGINRSKCSNPNWKLPFEVGFDLNSIKPRKYTRRKP